MRRVRGVVATKRDIGAMEGGQRSAAPRRGGAVSLFTCRGGRLSGGQANVSNPVQGRRINQIRNMEWK